MKSYVVTLPGKTKLRTKQELIRLLKQSEDSEYYELCAIIKETIDNYDELVKEYSNCQNHQHYHHLDKISNKISTK